MQPSNKNPPTTPPTRPAAPPPEPKAVSSFESQQTGVLNVAELQALLAQQATIGKAQAAAPTPPTDDAGFAETTQVTAVADLKAMMDRVRAETPAPKTPPPSPPASSDAPTVVVPLPTNRSVKPVSIDDAIAAAMPTRPAPRPPPASEPRAPDLVAHVAGVKPESPKRPPWTLIGGSAGAAAVIVLLIVFVVLPVVRSPTETPEDEPDTAASAKPIVNGATPTLPVDQAATTQTPAPPAETAPDEKPEAKPEEKAAEENGGATAKSDDAAEATPEKGKNEPAPSGDVRTLFQVKYPGRFYRGYIQSTEPKESDLKSLIEKVKSCSGSIVLVGHTCSLSGPSNEDLALKRAEFVADVLAKNGVPRDRITTESHGDSEPLASNDTEAGRTQNRRVIVECRAP